MSRLRSIAALLALSFTLVVSASAGATPIKSALHACSTGQVALGLHVSRAESAPTAGSVTGSGHAIVGGMLKEVRDGARGVCAKDARSTVHTQAAHLLWLYRHGSRSQARKALARLLAAIRASAHQASIAVGAHIATGCSFDGARHISLHDAAGVADDLAVARAAMLGGDDAGAQRALDAAQAAYAAWADAGAGGAQSAGDWMAVAAGAQLLGRDDVEQQALAHARSAAREGLEQAMQIDPCSVTKQDAPCVARAISIAMLLGIDSPSEVEAVTTLLEAAGEQAAGKIPNGCEQWSFTMQFKASNGTALTWGPGSFRVDRRAGTIADAPGVGAGWPGEIGADSGPCTEEGVVVGTGSWPAVPFHFNFSGSVTSAGFSLVLTSTDAQVSITVSGPPACQALGAIAQGMINTLLGTPYPLELPVAEGQRTVTLEAPSEDGNFTVTAQRTN